jgi:4-hydroxy-2-oxoheptanedioate aldolase
MRNRMREVLETKPHALGTFATLSDPNVVELIALAGFDYAIIECEHAALSLETVSNHFRAARARNLGILVRVPASDPGFLQRVIDIGAEGVLVPHVGSVQAAHAAVAAVRYPPQGHRGIAGAAPAADFGSHGFAALGELYEEINRSLVVTIMVEDRSAVEQIDDIARTPGLDAIHIGPSDLAASMGLIGTANHPELLTAIGKVTTACRSAGMRIGMPIENATYPRSGDELRRDGAALMTVGSDASYLLQALRDGAMKHGSGF